MSWTRRPAVLVLVALVVGMSACGREPDPDQGRRATDEIRQGVIDGLQAVVVVAEGLDEQAGSARGELRRCGDDGLGVSTYEYAASALLDGSRRGAEQGRVAALAEALVADGWEQSDVPRDDVAQLRRDDVTVTFQPSVRRDGSLVGDGSLDLSMRS